MSARQLIVILVAGVAAIGAIFLVRSLAPHHPVQTAEAATPINGEQVLVVARDVPQGAALTPSDLAVRLFPTESVSGNFVRVSQAPSAQADYVGAVTRRNFVAGEPIVQGSVIQPDGHGFMAAQLQPGFRAVAVEIKAETAAGGYISPNDHVDVILTQTIQVRDNGSSHDQVRSDIVLSDVRVLALDDIVQPQTSGQAPERHTANVAVLELTAADARTLAMADGMGDISLSLRGVEADAVGLATGSSHGGISQENGAVRVHSFGTVISGGGR
jgi:pilus assembly protein CpaB